MADDRVALFDADIAASPQALASLLDAWPADRPTFDPSTRIAFVGLGSSRFAAQVVAPLLRARGGIAWVDLAGPTAEAPAADVVVAISASGRTPEVVEVATRSRAATRIVAVTNVAESPLAAIAHDVVLLHAGTEASGIACRSFRATIAALGLLTGVATVDKVRLAVDALSALHAVRGAWSPRIVEALDGAAAIDVVAPRPLLGVAEQAALMFREAPRLPAHATETADWLHIGIYLAWAGHTVLRYSGSPADADLADTLARRGATLVDAPAGAGDPLLRSITDSLVAEVVAASLWHRTTASDK